MSERRTALVTGVGRTRGIGAAVARGLVADGWDLGLAYWDPYDQRVHGEGSDVHTLVDELRTEPRDVLALPGDLSDPEVPVRLVRSLSERSGTVSALVMAHCESVDSDLLTTTVESFDRHYAVNVRATWLLVKAFAEQLDDRGGSVVGFTSDHTAFNLPYGATKGALDRVVLAATHELAERGVRANVVDPGPIDTGWMDDATRTACAAATPGGRLGGPETAADLVRFLLSPEGRWINGQVLHSNGGFTTPAV
jgi:3-oxoacyl-[acyl-carrier protein] reductase